MWDDGSCQKLMQIRNLCITHPLGLFVVDQSPVISETYGQFGLFISLDILILPLTENSVKFGTHTNFKRYALMFSPFSICYNHGIYTRGHGWFYMWGAANLQNISVWGTISLENHIGLGTISLEHFLPPWKFEKPQNNVIF